ncbi:MAG: helix-turn-helix domain-containing protein [Verrucomicrobiota bacterium]
MSHKKLKTNEWFHQDGFPIAVERREPQAPFGMHAHEFSELVLITSGSGWHVTTKESWPLSAGDVFVISGSRPHTYERMDRLCLVNVLFQPDKLNLALFDLPTLAGYHALFTLEPAWRRRHQFKSRLHLSPPELRTVLGYLEQLETELKHRAPGFAFLSMANFMQIIGYLSRCYHRAWNPDSRALLRIAEAISHLETHYREPIELPLLAATAHMSRRSFMRAFQAATGNSPIAYLIQLRINRAANLLRQTDEPVTEIAFQVGFNDSNYFTRQFRSQMGVSPRVYRQQQPAK